MNSESCVSLRTQNTTATEEAFQVSENAVVLAWHPPRRLPLWGPEAMAPDSMCPNPTCSVVCCLLVLD